MRWWRRRSRRRWLSSLEAWLRLDGRPLEFASQGELVAYAGRVIRGIVIDHIRAKRAERHGGAVEFVPYDTLADLRAMKDEHVLRLDDTCVTWRTPMRAWPNSANCISSPA